MPAYNGIYIIRRKKAEGIRRYMVGMIYHCFQYIIIKYTILSDDRVIRTDGMINQLLTQINSNSRTKCFLGFFTLQSAVMSNFVIL